jgi:hypothetical protein
LIFFQEGFFKSRASGNFQYYLRHYVAYIQKIHVIMSPYHFYTEKIAGDNPNAAGGFTPKIAYSAMQLNL